MTPSRLAALVLLLVACDEPTTIADVPVEVPQGWSAEPIVDLPRRRLLLLSPVRHAGCELTVLRDGRSFTERDADALLGDAARAYGAERSVPRSTRLGAVSLEGRRLEKAQPPDRWTLTGSGPWTLDVFTLARGTELFSYVVAQDDHGPPPEACARAFGPVFSAP